MEWREIEGFEDYLIGSDGIVKSKQRKICRFNGRIIHEKTINERYLKPALSGSGYAFVCLRKNNRHHNKRIHVLVAEAFISKRPIGLVINHIDRNKLNNDIENLEYVSMQKNTQYHYIGNGKSIGRVPITDIPGIIKRVENGCSVYKIANEYNVTRNDISVLCKIIALTGEELILKQ